MLACVLRDYSPLFHTLEEVGCPLAHPRVDERLGRFNVVVEVVSESLDM